MNGMNQHDLPLLPAPPPPKGPGAIVIRIGDYVKHGVIMVLWTLVAAAALGALYVGLRAIYWAVNWTSQALGV